MFLGAENRSVQGECRRVKKLENPLSFLFLNFPSLHGNFGLPGIKDYFIPLTPLKTYAKLWKLRFMSFGFVSWIMEALVQHLPLLLGG